MIELIIIALAGSIIAGFWDLKTTEVPDEIPALMIASGLFIWYMKAGMTGDFYGLTASLLAGTALLGFGLLMYYKGQWGGADAWILASIGYLIPVYNGTLFIFDYLMNFLVVSALYMIIYALALGVKNPKIFSHLPEEFSMRKKQIALIFLVFSIPMIGLGLMSGFSIPTPLFVSFGLMIALVFFWVYAKVVEKYAFRKTIPVSRLRPGDVLEDMLWRGITQEEIDKLRKKKKMVTIKEGVRFVPVFPLTLIATFLFGNIMLLIF